LGIGVQNTAWGNKGRFDSSTVMREDSNKLDKTANKLKYVQ